MRPRHFNVARHLPFLIFAGKAARSGFQAMVGAGVAELVDAPDLGSGIERCGGSSPFTRTK